MSVLTCYILFSFALQPKLVLSTLENYVGTLTLNHSERRNALSHAVVEELIGGLKVLEDQKARAVILRAQPGVKVWCAGHDVNELPVSGRDPLSHADTLRRLVRSIEEFPAPVIALIEVLGCTIP